MAVPINSASPPRPLVNWKHLACLLSQAGMLVYILSRFIPAVSVTDYPIDEGLDYSWTLVLHDGFARNLQFGRDLVFTYGPWGFLARGYFPATFLTFLTAWTLLAVVFLIAGWRLARNLSSKHFISWLWFIALAGAVSVPQGNDFDVRLVAFVVMLLCLHFFVERDAFTLPQALLVISLGCLSLVKFTGLIGTLAVLFLITLNDLFRYRRFPWSLLVWGVSLVCFWLLAGQHLNLLGMFLHNSWQITSGYTEAMMLAGKDEVWDIGWFLVIAALLLLLFARFSWGRARFWGMLPLAGLGAVLFIVFKLGYVRHDRHQITSAMALVTVSLLLLAVVWPVGKRLAAANAALFVAAFVYASVIFHAWLPFDGLVRQWSGTFSVYNLMSPVAGLLTNYSRVAYEKNLERMKNGSPLPPIAGETDLYSYDQTVVYAHDLPYRPRPVIQSYSAYTPELAELNAAWLRSSQAADNLLFSIEPIDNRFPSLDDGLSWPELLTRYDLKETTGNPLAYLLLTRSATPRSYQLVPIGNAVVGFDQPVAVPALTNGLVWAEVEINKSLLGTVVSTLYKPPVLLLTVSFQHHASAVYRLIPAMARSGFLLSPVVADTRAFAALASPGHLQDLADQAVSAISISADTSSRRSSCYVSPFQFKFYRLEYPASDLKTAGLPR